MRGAIVKLCAFFVLGFVATVTIALASAYFVNPHRVSAAEDVSIGISAPQGPCWLFNVYRAPAARALVAVEISAWAQPPPTVFLLEEGVELQSIDLPQYLGTDLANYRMTPSPWWSELSSMPATDPYPSMTGSRVYLEDARGWPLPALRARVGPATVGPSLLGTWPPLGTNDGFSLGTYPGQAFVGVFRNPGQTVVTQTPRPRIFPLTPLWRGLLVDTIVNGGLLYLVAYGPGLALRSWRRRSGRCPSCGYIAGEHDRCSECGSMLRRARPPSTRTGLPMWLEEDAVARRERALEERRKAMRGVKAAIYWGFPIAVLFCISVYALVDPIDMRILAIALICPTFFAGMLLLVQRLPLLIRNRWCLEADRIRLRGADVGSIRWRQIRRWSIAPYERRSDYYVLRIGTVSFWHQGQRLLLNDARHPPDEVARIFEERVGEQARDRTGSGRLGRPPLPMGTAGHFEVLAAYVLGIGVPLLEAARRRTDFSDLPAYIDDFLAGALLVVAAWATSRGRRWGRKLLAAAWGVACGGLWYSVWGQARSDAEQDVSGLSNEVVVGIKLVIYAVAVVALVLTVWRRERPEAGGDG